ncbi:hypothetical protein ACFQY7_31835 [Actinomadura luteofluorescens]|uniref:hypothetical protein n=1 Tax=Actinomadura luteofluorescens TaxID=46163 RepID=UPI00362C482C
MERSICNTGARDDPAFARPPGRGTVVPARTGPAGARPLPAWRDQPRALACAVIAAFAVLTAAAFVFAVVAVVAAMR